MPSTNRYSRRWFDTFLGRIDAAIVAREIAFLRRQLPPADGRVLDLCCGPGRHAGPLAESGLDVIGLDLDARALGDARSNAHRAAFVRGDMRRLPLATARFDAAICMWQSFGHFDEDGNVAVLAELARLLRRESRLVLDVYHRGFHEAHLGERTIERDGVRVHEQRTMRHHRLRAVLHYEADGSSDEFEWRLYTPNELAKLAARAGFTLQLACAEFDEQVAASADCARMQLVFVKT